MKGHVSVDQALPSIRSSDSQKSRGFHFAAIGLLLFGALVRIVGFLQNASLSGDEAMLALSIGPRSFAELLQPLDYGQVAPVPFLWAERLMTMVGGVSGYTLRVIPSNDVMVTRIKNAEAPNSAFMVLHRFAHQCKKEPTAMQVVTFLRRTGTYVTLRDRSRQGTTLPLQGTRQCARTNTKSCMPTSLVTGGFVADGACSSTCCERSPAPERAR